MDSGDVQQVDAQSLGIYGMGGVRFQRGAKDGSWVAGGTCACHSEEAARRETRAGELRTYCSLGSYRLYTSNRQLELEEEI